MPLRLQIGLEGDKEIAAAFRRLEELGEDPERLLKQIGQYELNETKERFYEMRGPDGQPWEKLALVTILKKKQNKDRILVESQRLFNSLSWKVGRNELVLGTNVEYAAVQQFGSVALGEASGKGVRTIARYKYTNRKKKRGKVTDQQEKELPAGIPARPFLGWSTKDKAEILRMAGRAIEKALGKL